MPYEINNNIFYGANKLQEKNTWAFSDEICTCYTFPKFCQMQLISAPSNYKSSPDNSVHFICYSCQLEPIITCFTLTTGHFTKYKFSPDMYNGIIFISIKMF